MSDQPRIYTRCPACSNDTLIINHNGYLLCTWHECPHPVLINCPNPIHHVQSQLTASQARVKELELARIIHGAYECPKCGFTLQKNVLYVKTGDIGPEISNVIEHCPNDNEPMVHLTREKLCKNLEFVCETQIKRAVKAEQRIATLEQALRETTKVGVCVVIRNEFDQVLLGLKGRACSSEFLNKWVIPGGRLNYKEGIESGIRREIREETGIEIRISRFLPPQEVIHESGHFVFVICEAWHLSGQCVGNDDLTQVKWFDRDRLPVDMTPITRAALATISAALNEKEK